MRVALIAMTILAVMVGPAMSETYIDDFEGGANPSGWCFLASTDIIESTGGNPGYWLHQPTFDTFAPILQTGWDVPGPFVGDYRALNVTQIGIDAVTINNTFGNAAGFQFTLLLRDMNGTPSNVDDDDFAYAYFFQCPMIGEGWTHYDFMVPSADMSSVPAGWTGGWVGNPESFRPGVDWNDVITSVECVEFWWIHPAWGAMFQQWDVGADNISITFDGGSPVEDSSWGSIKAMYR